eukprot:TRINITY_DN4507_c0_g3_i1.p1 TRINITY_DN4507_c0_g3~~TRINITY_DN4507_c0_g3_i1.p1  ORF type:complete len:374 (+),score=25.73 TRINITY_DN4507_c0_g3_i1:121-1242(+)
MEGRHLYVETPRHGESFSDPGSTDSDSPVGVSCRRLAWQFFYDDLNAPDHIQRASHIYQVLFALYVVALFMVDSTTEYWDTTRGYWIMQLVGAIMWGVEYVLRLWCCVERDPELPSRAARCLYRIREASTLIMIVDAISLIALTIDLVIASNELRGVASLRMLRLFTFFRIQRDFNFFGPVFYVIESKRAMLSATLGIALSLLLISAVVMFYIEAPSNEDFSSVPKSMWWATAALTTVGYGDVVPQTGGGRVVASLVAFLGIGMFALPTGIVASGFQEYAEANAAEKRRRGMRVPNDADCAESTDLFSSGPPIEGADASQSLGQGDRALLGQIKMLLAAHEQTVLSQVRDLRKDVDAMQSDLQQIKSALQTRA